ncbi:FGGY-family carbohydrate kinase [Donghicola mangrovi]|uniref:Carbohydrate kinase n=1 Tax=Donghicola mangrovi TaxID=2729614 RepID=A0A850Q5G0_9RHOB|nr:FGGY-family carbohydrate kinase [Donghicola mangrovi]NVO24356.1 carbohydrate kinase [Donghicola mangrovi]
MSHIAVIDVGKTNAKLALVDSTTMSEVAVVTRPNKVLPGPPYPHFDLEGHWAFFRAALRELHQTHGIDAISVTTHGASGVLLDETGGLACPMLDYEHTGPDDLSIDYNALRPDFAATGSPRLPMGLNLGAQLHWLLETQDGLRDRLAHFVTYPQYWGYLLTGTLATDVTSLGCHTDLWNPFEQTFSPLVGALGLSTVMAPAMRSDAVLGHVTSALAAEIGFTRPIPVTCGIHDSNASLYPYLGQEAPFAVVSTGTWVVAMAIGTEPRDLDPARDVLVNTNALGQPVPSARFMGGREYELIRPVHAAPTDADRATVLDGILLLPSVEPSSGPFQNRQIAWIGPEPTGGPRLVALSWYLALMTRECLDLAGAQGPVIVEGPFARNADYLDMLAALSPHGVQVATSLTGTSVGAAMLAGKSHPPKLSSHSQPLQGDALRSYADEWRKAVRQ